jgi:hypothetical protein
MANNNFPVVAGFHAGIKVTIRPDLYPVFQNMQQLAVQGNHWARLSVSYLKSLSSGQFKNNVFVQDNGRLEQHEEYTIILPGCRAAFRKNEKGEFFIYALEADSNYSELQRSQTKPGLYRASRANDERWSAILVEDGKIQSDKNNTVVIADRYTSVDDALKYAPDAASSSGLTTGRILESDGFNLHFTPGKKRIGGLRNIHQAVNSDTDSDLHESAILLARAMTKSIHVKNVNWVSEGGGSGVLTQAMRILRDQNIRFADSGHAVFFDGITTNLVKAESLAREIGLKAERVTHKKNLLNPNQLIGSGFGGGYVTAYMRYRKDDKYTALKFGSDVVKETSAHKGVLATFGVTGAAVTSALGMSAGAIALPAGIAFAAAYLPKIIEAGTSIAEANFPQQVKKIKDKF